MANLVTGILALAGLIVFLGYYIVIIDALPLSIITVGVLLLPLYDFWSSLGRENGG